MEFVHRKLWFPCDAMQCKAAQARARAEWLLTCGPVPCRCSSGRCSSGSSSAPSMTLSLHGPRRSRSLPLLRSVRRRMLLINSLTAIAPRRRRRIIALEAIYSMRGARAGKMPISIDNRSPDFQRQGCNRRAWDMSAPVVYRARRMPRAPCRLHRQSGEECTWRAVAVVSQYRSCYIYSPSVPTGRWCHLSVQHGMALVTVFTACGSGGMRPR